jgi:hypothetical protein
MSATSDNREGKGGGKREGPWKLNALVMIQAAVKKEGSFPPMSASSHSLDKGIWLFALRR